MRRRDMLLGAGGLAVTLGAARGGELTPVPETTGPEYYGLLAAKEWAARPEIMRYDVPPVSAVHYAEAATALGVARLAGKLGDSTLMSLVRERWEKARVIPNTANHVDANVIGIWPMLLGDPEGAGVTLADGQWAETDPTGLTSQARMWIDDVWMIGALQAQGWRFTRRDRFLSRAGLTARTYVERLQRPNGLFFHGPDARFHWGRGNGWTAAGLAEVLSELPEDHPETGPTMAGFRKMMDALLVHQAEDGMWRQLVDRPESWKETSGTAMFGFAMMRGVNAGLLPADPFEAAARKAWGALTTYVDEQGRLSEVCVGTGQSQDVQYYLDRPRVTGDLHGQAPLLWFAAEMLG
jgi:hypothetical protein